MDMLSDDTAATFFWQDLYYSLNPDVLDANVDALEHYTSVGRLENRLPHPLLDPSLLTSSAQESAEGLPIGILASFLQGASDLYFHTLVDQEYMRTQEPALVTSQDCFRAVADPNRPLSLRPHPLFDPEFYRAVTPSRRFENELIDYILCNPTAGLPHPLFDGLYFLTTSGAVGSAAEPALLRYIRVWREWKGDVSPFVDLKFLNHQLLTMGITQDEHDSVDPLTYALTHKLNVKGPIVHPHIDSRIIERTFITTLRDFGQAPEALQVAEVIKRAIISTSSSERMSHSASAIILNYKKHVYTFLSIAAFLNSFRYKNVEVVVVENGGDAFYYEYMLKYFSANDKIKFIKPRANKFFGEGNNIGFDRTSGDYILLLNNDCFIAEDFAVALQSHISADPECEVIGSLLTYPDGSIQEFGGLVSDCGQVVQRAKGLPRSYLAGHRHSEEVDYTSAACLVISRQAMTCVAGFDLLFEPFYYEDTDLCRRLKHAGFKIVVSPSLSAIHIENASTLEELGSDTFHRMVRDHKEIFARRWIKDGGAGSYVTRPSSRNAAKRLSRGLSSAKPCAVVYTPFEMRTGGGERYLLSSARALSADYRVILCSDDHFSRARVLHVLLALGITEFEFEISDSVASVHAMCKDIEVLFAMGNEIIPPTPPIARLNLFHLQFPFPWRHLGRFNFEIIEAYDAIIVNSDFTRHWTNRRMSEVGVRLVPPVIELSPPVRRIEKRSEVDARSAEDHIRVVTVGRFFVGGHSKRQDVFLAIIAEARKQTSTKITATLIGAVHSSADAQAYYESIVALANQMDVEIIVDAPLSVLDQTLQNADVYIHCAGYGVSELEAPERMEHFGISIVEAIQAGCVPIVYAAGGAKEVIAKAGVGFVFQSVAVAAQQLVRLCEPSARRAALDSARGEWIESVLETAFAENLTNIVKKASTDRIVKKASTDRKEQPGATRAS
jgi:GT2 family glycosyltransferase/glycosyltransferase involved in cell wall biosynthesis